MSSSSDDEQSAAILRQSRDETELWDPHERAEILYYIPIDYRSRLDYLKEKAEISEGLCFVCVNCQQPWRWEDKGAEIEAEHIALSATNVMYMRQKFAKHALNPCPPCMCCVEGNYREDFEPKVRKLIPYEKITDVEVHEAGSNELVPPGCHCPPKCNPESIEVPISITHLNTAGSAGTELVIQGIEDAAGFRRKVLELKRGGAIAPPVQQQMGMPAPAAIGAASPETLAVLREIASSNREIVNSNREIVNLLQAQRK